MFPSLLREWNAIFPRGKTPDRSPPSSLFRLQETLKASINLDSFLMLKQNEIEVLLANVSQMWKKWIETPPTNVEQLANMVVGGDVKALMAIGH